MKKSIIVVMFLFVVLLVICGCSKSDNNYNSSATDTDSSDLIVGDELSNFDLYLYSSSESEKNISMFNITFYDDQKYHREEAKASIAMDILGETVDFKYEYSTYYPNSGNYVDCYEYKDDSNRCSLALEQKTNRVLSLGSLYKSDHDLNEGTESTFKEKAIETIKKYSDIDLNGLTYSVSTDILVTGVSEDGAPFGRGDSVNGFYRPSNDNESVSRYNISFENIQDGYKIYESATVYFLKNGFILKVNRTDYESVEIINEEVNKLKLIENDLGNHILQTAKNNDTNGFYTSFDDFSIYEPYVFIKDNKVCFSLDVALLDSKEGRKVHHSFVLMPK